MEYLLYVSVPKNGMHVCANGGQKDAKVLEFRFLVQE